jgi:hypothetical protein
MLPRLESPIAKLRLFFKAYPMGCILSGAIDNLLLIIEENRLIPDDIAKEWFSIWEIPAMCPAL